MENQLCVCLFANSFEIEIKYHQSGVKMLAFGHTGRRGKKKLFENNLKVQWALLYIPSLPPRVYIFRSLLSGPFTSAPIVQSSSSARFFFALLVGRFHAFSFLLNSHSLFFFLFICFPTSSKKIKKEKRYTHCCARCVVYI